MSRNLVGWVLLAVSFLLFGFKLEPVAIYFAGLAGGLFIAEILENF